MYLINQVLSRATQQAGIEIVRYPQNNHIWRMVQLMHHHGIKQVLDVGANAGQFAASLRRQGFVGEILSFEPLAEPYAILRKRSSKDPKWRSMQCAIGGEEKLIQINVAGNQGASSSVLPMLKRHEEAAPDAGYIGTQEVQQYSLDELVPRMWENAPGPIFLKIDVQGYERPVLEGAAKLLKSGTVKGLQLELSFVPLYEGAMTWQEGIDRAKALGMTLMTLEPAFTDPSNHQMLQADVVFFQD